MQNFKMLSAVVETDAEVINPNGETFVDLMMKPGLPESSEEVPPPPRQIYGLIAPGEKSGDELIIRLHPQREINLGVAGTTGPAVANFDHLNLLCIPTGANVPAIDGMGAEQQGGIHFPPFASVTGGMFPTVGIPAPAMAILRWVGNRWLAQVLSAGVGLTADLPDIIPTSA